MKGRRIISGGRLFLIVTALFAVILSACALAACTDEHTHTLKHHAAVSPTCKNGGNTEYWECTDCGKFFSDPEGKTEITKDSATLSATNAHDWDAWRVSKVATCTEDGARTRMCVECGATETETVPAAHVLTERKGVEADCGNNGVAAHFYCTQCHKYFGDAAAERELSYNDDVWRPATGEHVWTEWSEAVTDCTHGGERTRSCTVCGRKDRESVPAGGHVMSYHAEESATCGESGTAAYWECGACGLLFADPAGKTAVTRDMLNLPATGKHSYGGWTNVKDPTCTQGGERARVCGVCGFEQKETLSAYGHEMDFIAAEAATCEKEGNIAHYRCGVCGLNFEDEEGKTLLSSVTEEKRSHDMTHHSASAASCTKEGNIEYWSCSMCLKNYLDEDGLTAAGAVTVAPTNHINKEYHAAAAASCTRDGNREYYYCPDCGAYFNADMNEITAGEILVPGGHSLYYVKRTDATCGAAGEIEHWACENCTLLFSDAQGKNEVTVEALVIPQDKNGHVFVNHKCEICSYIRPAEEYATTTLKYYSSMPGKVMNIGSASGESSIVIPAYYLSQSGEYVEVTAIGQSAFAGYKGDVIVIPGTVTTIESKAFDGCTATIIFEGPTNMQTLNNNAFENYAGTTVILPEGLVNIGRVGTSADSTAVFYNCPNLEYVYIPVSVKFICGACFSGTGGFTIYYEGTQAQYDTISKENYYLGALGYTEQMEVPRPELLY